MWNQKQRRKVSEFLSLNPIHELVISTATLKLATRVLHIIERVSGAEYTSQQHWESLEGRNSEFRVTALCNDRLQQVVLPEAESLLTRAEAYAALPEVCRTWHALGLAFALVSSTVCAMEYYLFKPWRGFPWQVFMLLSCESASERDSVAKDILDKPHCMRDAWAARFLTMYDTIPKLTSMPCLALLQSIASELHFDIVKVECRHASLRRLQRNRAATHLAHIGDVSADFLLQNLRREGAVLPEGEASQPPIRKKARKLRVKACIGVGPQRHYLSQLLRRNNALPLHERLGRKELFQKGNQGFRRLKAQGGEEWQSLVESSRQRLSVYRPRASKKKRGLKSETTAGPLKKAKVLLSRPQTGQPSVSEILHTETLMQAESSVAQAAHLHEQASSEERRHKCKRDVALQAWAEEAWQKRKCLLCPGVKRHISPPARPAAEMPERLTNETFLAPVHSYLCHFLDVPHSEMLQKMQDAWGLKHVPFKHVFAPAVKLHPKFPPLSASTGCFKAGRCLCGQQQSQHRVLIRNVSAFLRSLFEKKSVSRQILDGRRGVLCLKDIVVGIRCFWHVGYTNRKAGEFILLQLEQKVVLEDVFNLPTHTLLLTRIAV